MRCAAALPPSRSAKLPEHPRKQATRAFWSGTITFGLVSIPVDLFAAVQARQTSMRMVDAEGEPLGRRYFCQKDGKELEDDEIVRGYEAERGKIVVVTDEELESVAPEMTRDIELRRFVPSRAIPAAYYQRPYFLAPSGSAKAYHLLAAVLAETGQVGIGTFVMRGHQHLVGIFSQDGMLRAHTLRFAQELRSPKAIGISRPKRKVGSRRTKAFAAVLEKMKRDGLAPDEMSDGYALELQKLAEKKKKKREDVVKVGEAESEDADEGAEVIDLMKVLKQRLSAAAPKKPAARQRRAGKRGAPR
jgi:DNA end-binding protein Ku